MYRLKERFLHWFWAKVPNSILYWAVIHAWARSTTNSKFSMRSPDEVTWVDTLDVLEGRYEKKS